MALTNSQLAELEERVDDLIQEFCMDEACDPEEAAQAIDDQMREEFGL